VIVTRSPACALRTRSLAFCRISRRPTSLMVQCSTRATALTVASRSPLIARGGLRPRQATTRSTSHNADQSRPGDGGPRRWDSRTRRIIQ
jgi:hypothetical protein